ncbi:MAG: asparaginase, partial [Bryobacteraceae bacterium]
MSTIMNTGTDQSEVTRAPRARVYILYTGGTIGMAPEEPGRPGSPLVPQPLDALMKYVPGLDNLNIRLEYEAFDRPLDSSNLGPEHWIDMARRIERVYDANDGFVILHGTDTMCYTSSALSFMFENLAKPVVITGSQLPISAVRTDAVINLVNAVYVAGYKSTNLPCIPEVMIVFADKILRGCRARKVSSTSWAGFDSPNYPALGHIGEHIRVYPRLLRPFPAPGQKFQVSADLSDRVMDISLFPGFKPSQLRQVLLETDGVDGVVLRTFGAGNAPDREEFLKVIDDARSRKKTVVNTTQCLEGMVEMGLYEASSGLLARGVISALDMTPEAVLTKLMWTLGTKIGDQVVTQMQVSQRGEQSENLFDLRYGGCGSAEAPQESFHQYCTPDRRFDVGRLTKAVVRLSGLGVDGVKVGDGIQVRVFMNLPSANSQTPATHQRCIGAFPMVWRGDPVNLLQELEDEKARSAIGDGDVTLSVVAERGVRVWFEGLYL